jgi:hypothetical protein
MIPRFGGEQYWLATSFAGAWGNAPDLAAGALPQAPETSETYWLDCGRKKTAGHLAGG